MGSEISKLAVTLTANAGGLVAGFKQGEGEMESFKGVAEGVNGVLERLPETLAAVGIGLEAFEIFKTAADNEDSFARLSAVVKSTGEAAGFTSDQLEKMAEELSETTKYEKSAVTSAEAMLATFTEIKGKNFEEAMKAAANLSTILGTDLKESVIQVGKALNDPAEGYTALKRAGVSFTESQVQQIKTLQESGHVTEAQAIILKELEREFGGAAEAANNTFSGAMVQAKKAINEAGAEILTGLTPALVGMAHHLKAAADWAHDHKEALKAMGKAIGVVITAVLIYKTAMFAITAAQKAWNIVQVVTLALQGWRGWAKLAIGLAAAAAGYAVVTSIQDKANKSLADSEEESKKAKEQLEKVGGAGDVAAGGFETAHKSAKELAKDVAQLNEHLKEQIATFGMSAHEAEVYKLSMQGATEEQLMETKALAEKLEIMELYKKAQESRAKLNEELAKDAEKIIEDLKDPYEKLGDTLREINRLEHMHLLTAEQAAAASQKAADEMVNGMEKADKHAKKFEPKNWANEHVGTIERRFTKGFSTSSIPVLEKIHQEQLKIAKATEEANRIARAKREANRVTIGK